MQAQPTRKLNHLMLHQIMVDDTSAEPQGAAAEARGITPEAILRPQSAKHAAAEALLTIILPVH
ncbi:MAG TPA: hypothetical protein DCL60_06950 [Armatimonadetes bacterium]|nr:hypothetical protein [Armatimonadota bacterium]